MVRSVLISSVFFSCAALAQDMAPTENYRTSYRERPDGSSEYVGRCATHEDYLGVYYERKSLLQKSVEPGDLSPKELQKLIALLGPDLVSEVLKTLELTDLSERKLTPAQILHDYVDDIEAETLSYQQNPGLNLLRLNVGVGGGNGAYLVFNKSKASGKTKYEMLSHTFDRELNFCDKKVWLTRP